MLRSEASTDEVVPETETKGAASGVEPVAEGEASSPEGEASSEASGGASGGEEAAKEFVSAGEGTASDGKGGSKKIFFLQQKKEEQPRWLKKMSEGLSSVGAAAGETVSRLTKPAPAAPASDEPKVEEKEAAKMETEDKKDDGNLKSLVEAGRHSLDAASTRFSGLMASMKPAPKSSATPESEAEAAPAPAPASSNMSAFRLAMSGGRKEDKPNEVAALKAEVAELKAIVAALAEKVAKLEKAAEASS